MALRLDRLWAVHPSITGNEHPCSGSDGTPNFDNQCAIRMGICLQLGGVDMSRYPRSKCCWFGHPSPRHVLRAEELAAWMRARPATFGKMERYLRVTVDPFIGRRGIVMFRNFWGPGLQGDHIDLWDRDMMTNGSIDYFERSQEVWWWPLK